MIQRLIALCRYLSRSVAFSLTGILFVISAVVYYYLAFQQQSPEVEYFATMIGIFGGAAAFLIALAVAGRANEATSYPFLTRLPSRIEYLTAVLATAVFLTVGLQLLVAILALLRNGPELTLARALQLPPGWLALDILAAVIALHAADFVAAGWTRVYFFGAIALLMFGRTDQGGLFAALGSAVRALANFTLRQGWNAVGRTLTDAAAWLSGDSLTALGSAIDLLFWPFKALINAAVTGTFSGEQAMAPAVLVIYATVIFWLAADIFAHKDLYLSEGQ